MPGEEARSGITVAPWGPRVVQSGMKHWAGKPRCLPPLPTTERVGLMEAMSDLKWGLQS